MADITRSHPQLELYKREFVSIYAPKGYRYGYRFGTGETLENRSSFTTNANIDELYKCVSRYARYRFWYFTMSYISLSIV